MGYRIIGDNLDKNVIPRYRRIDHQTESLHFFQYYAVRDRIDLSGVSDDVNPYLKESILDLPLNTLLPSASDHQAMMYNFGVLISRVLVEELKYFSMTFDEAVTKHIPHP